MTLSLCMIVRDEEKALPTCLASVQGIVDEIVIVDTGSVDQTVAIAQQWGATVYPFDWCDDFAAARNASLQHATGTWILVLDADEVLLPDMVPSLQQVMQTEDVLAVTLLREEVGTQLPYSSLSRLFRNRADIRFCRPYHELIDDSVQAILQQEPHWRIAALPGVAIQHTGYQTDVIIQRQKGDRARTIMTAYLQTHPDDAYICNKLGALHVAQGNLKTGLALLEQGLHAPAIELPLLCELHYHLGTAWTELNNPTKAIWHYQQAVELPIAPLLKLGAYNNWGSLLQEQGDLNQAVTLFRKLVAIAPDFATGHFNLGVSLKSMGDFEGAIACYETAIQLHPDYADAYQNLGVVLLKRGRVTESLAAFQRAIALHTSHGSPEADRLRQTLQAMGLWQSIEHESS